MTPRPSPTESATWYEPGTYKQGNDGNMYTINVTAAGIHRWIPSARIVLPHEILSPKHPSYVPPLYRNPTYKFNVGDTVRVVRGGSGCGKEDIGKEVVIIRKGMYDSDQPGYEVSPAIGNSRKDTAERKHVYDMYDGMLSEKTFELVVIQTQVKPLNLNKMAKSTKTITKKTTQEVRQIDYRLCKSLVEQRW
jgi:hypothetical protein